MSPKPDTKTDLSALNDQQRYAVVSEGKRLLVLAGAGSGKTRTLLRKLIHLIEEKGVNPASILAITFTRNAANEMIDRLILSADVSQQYERLLNESKPGKSNLTRGRARFRKRFRWIDNLTIKTFHGFCYGILRHDGVNEFDNRFRIISEEKRDEEDELSRHIAPKTAFEVFHKLVIEACEETEYLLDLKR